MLLMNCKCITLDVIHLGMLININLTESLDFQIDFIDFRYMIKTDSNGCYVVFIYVIILYMLNTSGFFKV